MHVNSREGPGFVGVRQLQLMSFDEVHEIPDEARYLGIALHEFPRRSDDCSAQIAPPMSFTTVTAAFARLRAWGARLRFFSEYLFNRVVVHDCHRIAA